MVSPPSPSGSLSSAQADAYLASDAAVTAIIGLIEKVPPGGGLRGDQRVYRAVRLGREAASRVGGEYVTTRTIKLALRNRFYAIARDLHNRGFYVVEDFREYQRAVVRYGQFGQGTASHAFPTREEAEAYLLGFNEGPVDTAPEGAQYFTLLPSPPAH